MHRSKVVVTSFTVDRIADVHRLISTTLAKAYCWIATAAIFILAFAYTNLQKQWYENCVCITHAHDRTASYGTPLELFHIDRLISKLITELRYVSAGEEYLDPSHTRTVPIENWPRHIVYNNLVAQWTTGLFEHPQAGLQNFYNSPTLRNCMSYRCWYNTQNKSVSTLYSFNSTVCIKYVSTSAKSLASSLYTMGKSPYAFKKCWIWLLLPNVLHCSWKTPRITTSWARTCVGQWNYCSWH